LPASATLSDAARTTKKSNSHDEPRLAPLPARRAHPATTAAPIAINGKKLCTTGHACSTRSRKAEYENTK
jgi:hypothetical protein